MQGLMPAGPKNPSKQLLQSRISAGNCSVRAVFHRKITRVLASKLRDGLNLLRGPSPQKPDPANKVSINQLATPITAHYLSKLYTTDFSPEKYVGSVAIRKIREKGWGLATTAAVTAGELLLVSSPIAIVKGTPGELPTFQSLVAKVGSTQLSPQQKGVLAKLHDGEERSMDVRPPILGDLAGSSKTGGAAAVRLDPQQIESILQLNAYGHPHQDAVVSRLRGDEACSVLGLWPEFSFLNHSCMPSAVHLLVGDRMMVRATRDIPAKQEVTINYLGRGSLMPFDDRQQDLQGSFGFSCSCPRCKLETRFYEETASVLSGIQELLADVQPVVMSAMRAGDRETLVQLKQQLDKAVAGLHSLRSQLALNTPTAMQLYSAVFDLFWAVMKINMALEPRALHSMRSMATCLELAGLVVPGSELHTLLASKLAMVAGAVFGTRDSATSEASLQAVAALQLRYGDVGMAMLQQLMRTGAEVADELDRV